jgi:hypothetical protein
VKGTPLPPEQVAVDGLAREGVPKLELLVARLDDELTCDQLLRDSEEGGLVDMQHLAEQLEVKAPARNRRQP